MITIKDKKFLLIYLNPTDDSPRFTTPLSILYPGEFFRRRGAKEVHYIDDRSNQLNIINYNKYDYVCFSVMVGKQCERFLDYYYTLKTYGFKGKIVIGGPIVQTLTEKQLPKLDNVIYLKGDFETNLSPFNTHTKRFYMPPYEPYVMTSTGCWGKCTFCSLNAKWTPIPTKTIRSILHKLENLKVKNILITDPNFGAIPNRISQIFAGFNFNYHVNMRFDSITPNMIKVLEDTGCTSVEFGGESGDNFALRNIINKGETVELMIEKLKLLSKSKISPMVSFMYAYPMELLSTRNDTISFIKKIKRICPSARISMYKYIPVPGNKMGDEYLINDKTYENTFQYWSNIKMSGSSGYWIVGLTNRKDATAQNFPGLRRVLIVPFELLAHIYWFFNIIETRWFPVKTIERLVKWSISKKQ